MESPESFENKSKSILKTPRPRQPLQPVDFCARSNEATLSVTKSKRRVSFADKKRIKEFCDSGEHSSYEVSELSTNKVTNSLSGQDGEIVSNLSRSTVVSTGDCNYGDNYLDNVQSYSDPRTLNVNEEHESLNNGDVSCVMDTDDYCPITHEMEQETTRFQVYEDAGHQPYNSIIQQPSQIYLDESMEFTRVVSTFPLEAPELEKDDYNVEENMEEDDKSMTMTMALGTVSNLQAGHVMQLKENLFDRLATNNGTDNSCMLSAKELERPTILGSKNREFGELGKNCVDGDGTVSNAQALENREYLDRSKNKSITEVMALALGLNIDSQFQKDNQLQSRPDKRTCIEDGTEFFNNKSMTMTMALESINTSSNSNKKICIEDQTELLNNKSMTITRALGNIYTTKTREPSKLKSMRTSSNSNEKICIEDQTELLNNESMQMTMALGSESNLHSMQLKEPTIARVEPTLLGLNTEDLNDSMTTTAHGQESKVYEDLVHNQLQFRPNRRTCIEDRTEFFNDKSMTMTMALESESNLHATQLKEPTISRAESTESKSTSLGLNTEDLNDSMTTTAHGQESNVYEDLIHNQLQFRPNIRTYIEDQTELLNNESMQMTMALESESIPRVESTGSKPTSLGLNTEDLNESMTTTAHGQESNLYEDPIQNRLQSRPDRRTCIEDRTEFFNNKSMTMTMALESESNLHAMQLKSINDSSNSNKKVCIEDQTELLNNKSMTMTRALGNVYTTQPREPTKLRSMRTSSNSNEKICIEDQTELLNNKSMTITRALGNIYTTKTREPTKLKSMRTSSNSNEKICIEDQTELLNNESMQMTMALESESNLHAMQLKEPIIPRVESTESMSTPSGLDLNESMTIKDHGQERKREGDPIHNRLQSRPDGKTCIEDRTEFFNNKSMTMTMALESINTSSNSNKKICIEDQTELLNNKSMTMTRALGNVYTTQSREPTKLKSISTPSNSNKKICIEDTTEFFNNKSMTMTTSPSLQPEFTQSLSQSITMELGENISKADKLETTSSASIVTTGENGTELSNQVLDPMPMLELSHRNNSCSVIVPNFRKNFNVMKESLATLNNEIEKTNYENMIDESIDEQQTNFSFMKNIDFNTEQLHAIELSLISNGTVDNNSNLNLHETFEQMKNHSTSKRTLTEDFDESNKRKAKIQSLEKDDESGKNQTQPIFDPMETNFEEEFENGFASIVEKLKIHSLRDQCIWEVTRHNIEKNVIAFAFIGGSLLIAIYFSNNENNDIENIRELKTFSLLKDSSNVTMNTIHRLLLEEFNLIELKNLINSHEILHMILTLLDYISERVKLMMDFMFDLENLDDTNLMQIENERVSFTTYSTRMDIILKVTVNIKLLEKIDSNDVSVCCILGDVREEQVKQLIKNVKRDHKFLRRYMDDVQDYANLIEKLNSNV